RKDLLPPAEGCARSCTCTQNLAQPADCLLVISILNFNYGAPHARDHDHVKICLRSFASRPVLRGSAQGDGRDGLESRSSLPSRFYDATGRVRGHSSVRRLPGGKRRCPCFVLQWWSHSGGCLPDCRTLLPGGIREGVNRHAECCELARRTRSANSLPPRPRERNLHQEYPWHDRGFTRSSFIS
ncbi:unnamed protein product, partial [Amoebophrya sp. A25]